MADFYNSLSSVVCPETLDELNFSYSHSDDFNQMLAASDHSTDISIFHMNIRSLNKNKAKLHNFLSTLNISFDVIVLSEIWNCNLDLYKNLFSGYTFYYDVPAGSSIGGIGVYVNKKFSCNVRDSLRLKTSAGNMAENIWLELCNGKQNYVVGAIYRHPNQNINEFTEILETNLDLLSNSRVPCFIAGDLNIDLCKYSSHNPTKDYVNSLISSNFLPVVIMPTRIIDNSATIIDHIYYNAGYNKNKDLVVRSGNLWCDVTDHLPNFIIIDRMQPVKEVQKRPLIRLHSPINVQKFCDIVSGTEWSNILCCNDPNKAYETFETQLQICHNTSFPLVKLSRKCVRDKKWVTAGIKTSCKQKDKLYKKWISTKNKCDELSYKNYRRMFKVICKEAETKYYRTLFDTKCNSLKQLWSNLNRSFSLSKTKCSSDVTKLIVNNSDITKPVDICNIMNDYFCSVGKNLAAKIKTSADEFVKYCHKQTPTSMVCEPTNRAEIINIVSSFRDNKSPGHDNIGPKLLKLILNFIIDPLVHIYNLSFATGCVPLHLKIAKVIPVFKKGDKTNPSNYRPISLLSIFDKILEKLMYKRLYSFLNKNSILYQYQFGFRRHHSTSLALLELTDSLYSHLDTHDMVIGMYFDLQKAFDTVDHNILLRKLYNYGIRGIVHDWFRNYLSNRKQFVSIANSESSIQNVVCGVPQGSVLGPLLFLLYVNDISNASTVGHIKLFADDTNVFIFGKCLEDIYNKANSVVSELNDWFVANKLSLSIEKSCYSVFNCRGTPSQSSSVIKLHDTLLSEVTACKYLGVMIDSDLKWQIHIDQLYSKLLRFTSIFYQLRCCVNIDVLMMLYFAFVHSQLQYGIEVYANTSNTHLNKLIVLNNKILRIIQNKPIRTHVIDLYRKLNILPLPQLHQFQLLCLVHKFVNSNNKLPTVFSNYFTINNEVHSYNTRSSKDLHLARFESVRGARCIKFKASREWNNLPEKIKSIKNFYSFKMQLKNYFLETQ